jgi:hypothetical protein
MDWVLVCGVLLGIGVLWLFAKIAADGGNWEGVWTVLASCASFFGGMAILMEVAFSVRDGNRARKN